jgi:hypothetical protein
MTKRDHFGDPDVDGIIIIIIWMFWKQGVGI